MNKQQLKMTGIICLVISGICFFIAIERYITNAGNVRGMNALRQQSEQRMNEFEQQHFPPNFRQQPTVNSNQVMVPGIPSTTVYATLFGLIIAVAGGIFLKKSKDYESYLKPCV